MNIPDDLPAELVAELSKQRTPMQNLLLRVIEANGGPMCLNAILIAIWRETGCVVKRSGLRTCVHNAAKTGKIRRVGIGVYDIAKSPS